MPEGLKGAALGRKRASEVSALDRPAHQSHSGLDRVSTLGFINRH